MRKFLTRIALYVSVLAAIIAAVNMLYIYLEPEHNAVNFPENIQICTFGSSHGKYDFNYDDFGKYTCAKFAMNSQSLLYDYRLLQHYKDKLSPGAVVFIDISYFSFFGRPEVEEEMAGQTFQSKNKRYYKILPPELILQYDWRTNMYINYLPCLSPGGLSMFIKRILKPKSEQTIYSNEFEVDDETWLRVTTSRDVKKYAPHAYNIHVAGRFDDSGRRLRRQESFEAIYAMIDLCRQLNARPILITTPYLREYTDTIRKNDPEFFPDFYAVIDEIRNNTGIDYYDYAFDERFCSDYSMFINTDHLNRQGARKFTATLLHEVLGIDPD